MTFEQAFVSSDAQSGRNAHLSIHVPGLLLLSHAGKQLLLVITDIQLSRLGGSIKQHAEVASSPLRNHLL